MFTSRLGCQAFRTLRLPRPVLRTAIPPPRRRPSQWQFCRSFHQSPSPQAYYRPNRFQQTQYLLYRWAARPSFYYEVGGITFLAAGFYTYNLETVPVSGRRRFNMITPEYEAKISKEQFGQIMQEYRGRVLDVGDKRSVQVRRVLERLIPNSGLQGVDWEVFVVRDEEPNAFVIPGGKVFVFTGILPICQDDNGVAAVLGHEIAHTLAHHAAERMSKGGILAVVGIVLSYALGLPDTGISNLLLDLAFNRPNGRAQEAEADYIGLMMMAESCYNPAAAVPFWQRMAKLGGTPPELLSTHPSPEHRVENMQHWLPEAQQKRNDSECGHVSGYADQLRTQFPEIRW